MPSNSATLGNTGIRPLQLHINRISPLLPASSRTTRGWAPPVCLARRFLALTILFLSSCVFLWVIYSAGDPFFSRRPAIHSPSEWSNGDINIGTFSEPDPNISWLFPTTGLLPPQTPVRTKVSVGEFADTLSFTKHQLTLLPPTYPQYFDHEMKLSMQNVEKHPRAKYLNLANFSWRSGFGNVMQDFVFHCMFTFDIGRTPVYNPYTWRKNHKDFSTFNGTLIPRRVPLSAMFAGPITGGPMPSDRPLAISRAAFDKICKGRKRVIAMEQFEPPIDGWADGQVLYDTWAKHIRAIDDECLEIRQGSPLPFDVWFFGMKRMHSVMDIFLNSPVLQYFTFSPLICDAYNKNVKLFVPAAECSENRCSTKSSHPDMIPNSHDTTHISSPHAISTPSNLSPSWKNMKSIPGLLVLHLRRGDHLQHCTILSEWTSDFQGINSMLTNKYSSQPHPDEFVVPTEGGNGVNTPENSALYQRRCLPSITDVVNKVREIRASYEERYASDPTGTSKRKRLSSIYIMTNGKGQWLSDMKQSLLNASDEILEVHSSRELDLTHEQKYVPQTVDMLIGARADVFIGTGFSSMTSNVVMLRMARGTDPLDTRFW